MNINFYILDQVGGLRALHFACQLIEKAYAEQKQVYIHTNSREEAERFDALLWTYRDDSFIPHQLLQHTPDKSPPIEIGFGDDAPTHQDTLINLSREIPACYQQFQNLIEIVYDDQEIQQLARNRYKHYRDLGLEINTHKLKVNQL